MTALRKIVAMAFATLTIAVLAAGCGSSDDPEPSESNTDAAKSDEPILIGHVMGATGFMQFYDVAAHEAAKLAIEDINAKGGVLGGRQLEIDMFDMKTDPPLGVGGVEEMLGKGADILFSSSDLDTSAPMLSTAEERKTVIFSPAGSDYRLGLFGNYTYAMGLASNVQGAAGAEWAYNEKKWRDAYVVVDLGLAITKSAGQFFIERFGQLEGTNIIGTATFQNDDPSIASQITKIKNASPQPEFIYLSSYIPGSAKAIKQIRDAGITLPILCQISCGEGVSWLKGVGDLSDFYYTNMGYVYGPEDPNEQIWDLAQRFKEKTGKDMELSLDLGGYASVQMVAWAIDKAGSTDSDAVTEALQSADGVETILGPITFTPEFHMPYDQPVRIGEIKDGKHSFIGTWQAEKVNLDGKNLPDL